MSISHKKAVARAAISEVRPRVNRWKPWLTPWGDTTHKNRGKRDANGVKVNEETREIITNPGVHSRGKREHRSSGYLASTSWCSLSAIENSVWPMGELGSLITMGIPSSQDSISSWEMGISPNSGT